MRNPIPLILLVVLFASPLLPGRMKDTVRALSGAGGLFFAHVVAGGGYSTTFIITNTGATAAAGTMTLTDQVGSPLVVVLAGSVAGSGSSFPISLAPAATAILTATRAGAPDARAGWARIESTGGSLDGVASFEYSEAGVPKSIAGVLASAPVEAAVVPVDNDGSVGRYSGFGVANTGAGDIHLTLRTYGEDGLPADTSRPPEFNPLGPRRQAARFLHELIPSRLNFRGSMRLYAEPGEGFAVVALNLDRGHYTAVPVMPQAPEWKLVWADEFDGPDNSAVDASRWVLETGGGGWGNNELETYTKRLENAHIESGSLVISAIKETYTGSDGITRNYTSARLKTQGRFEQRYGRFEARLKLPSGQGLWPAFWMLGNDIASAGWPACGEIDIMENVGREPSTVHGTIHGPGYSGGSGIGAALTLPGGQRFSDDYHVFALEWEPDSLRWKVDGVLFQTRTPADLPAGRRWVFDHPHFILLNLAVGGNWPGSPDATTTFPQKLSVDYVRVYERSQ